MPSDALVERFWNNLVVTDDCWLWDGPTNKKGYGVLEGARGTSIVFAHRLGYELQHGVAPGELCVCHTCDNPPCVRGSHLFLGTRADNNRDRHRKGRYEGMHGVDHGQSKLTPEQVEHIRGSTESGGALARRFGVSQSTVWRARSGVTWKFFSNARANALTTNALEN